MVERPTMEEATGLSVVNETGRYRTHSPCDKLPGDTMAWMDKQL